MNANEKLTDRNSRVQSFYLASTFEGETGRMGTRRIWMVSWKTRIVSDSYG